MLIVCAAGAKSRWLCRNSHLDFTNKVDKKALFSLKFNAHRCRHIKSDVTTSYYPNRNPNPKRVLNVGPETLTLILKPQSAQNDGGLRL